MVFFPTAKEHKALLKLIQTELELGLESEETVEWLSKRNLISLTFVIKLFPAPRKF